MVNNVKILPQLYNAFHSDIAPTEQEMLIQLLNITHKDRSELQPLLAQISKLYKDALPYISVNSMASSSAPMQIQRQAPTGNFGTPEMSQPQNSDTLTINDEGIAMSIKKDKEHLETAKDLIELYLKKVDDGKKASKKPV